jgi:hypothetical protein
VCALTPSVRAIRRRRLLFEDISAGSCSFWRATWAGPQNLCFSYLNPIAPTCARSYPQKEGSRLLDDRFARKTRVLQRQVYLEASRALVVTGSEEEAAYQRCNTSFALTMAGPYRVFVFA